MEHIQSEQQFNEIKANETAVFYFLQTGALIAGLLSRFCRESKLIFQRLHFIMWTAINLLMFVQLMIFLAFRAF